MKKKVTPLQLPATAKAGIGSAQRCRGCQRDKEQRAAPWGNFPWTDKSPHVRIPAMEKRVSKQPKSDHVKQKDFDGFASLVKRKFDSLDTRIDSVETKLNSLETKADKNHNQVMTTLDRLVKLFMDQKAENAAQVYVNKRHETWIKDLAKHTDHTLNKNA
jgi:hypothetical protein